MTLTLARDYKGFTKVLGQSEPIIGSTGEALCL